VSRALSVESWQDVDAMTTLLIQQMQQLAASLRSDVEERAVPLIDT